MVIRFSYGVFEVNRRMLRTFNITIIDSKYPTLYVPLKELTVDRSCVEMKPQITVELENYEFLSLIPKDRFPCPIRFRDSDRYCVEMTPQIICRVVKLRISS